MILVRVQKQSTHLIVIHAVDILVSEIVISVSVIAAPIASPTTSLRIASPQSINKSTSLGSSFTSPRSSEKNSRFKLLRREPAPDNRNNQFILTMKEAKQILAIEFLKALLGRVPNFAVLMLYRPIILPSVVVEDTDHVG
jgi:hypothetical protein